MITLGYNNNYSGISRAISAILIGILLIISQKEAYTYIVQVGAAIFILSGVYNIGQGLFKSKKNDSLFYNAIINIALGVLLFIYAAIVGKIIITAIGILLLIFSFLQLIVYMSIRNLVGVNMFSYALSTVCLLAGLLLVLQPNNLYTSLIAGSGLIIYGASELFSTFHIRKARKAYAAEYDIKNNANRRYAEQQEEEEDPTKTEGFEAAVQDVKFEKVDDKEN